MGQCVDRIASSPQSGQGCANSTKWLLDATRLGRGKGSGPWPPSLFQRNAGNIQLVGSPLAHLETIRAGRQPDDGAELETLCRHVHVPVGMLSWEEANRGGCFSVHADTTDRRSAWTLGGTQGAAHQRHGRISTPPLTSDLGTVTVLKQPVPPSLAKKVKSLDDNALKGLWRLLVQWF